MLDQDLSALDAHFFNEFDPDDAALPILVENQPSEDLDETQPWCRWTISPGASEASTTGPSALYTQLGTATLQIFVPSGQGKTIGYEVRSRFETLFRSWRSSDRFLRVYKVSNTSFQPAGTDKEKPPFQINCTIFWESRRATND